MPREKQLALPHKAVYLVIAVICLMLGVAGLILPIIPGFLFVLAAVYCLSKVSSRFRYWAEQQPLLQKLQDKVSRLNTLDYATKAKVFALMTLDMMVQSFTTAASLVKRVVRQRVK